MNVDLYCMSMCTLYRCVQLVKDIWRYVNHICIYVIMFVWVGSGEYCLKGKIIKGILGNSGIEYIDLRINISYVGLIKRKGISET